MMHHVCEWGRGGGQSQLVGFVLMTVLTNGVYTVAGESFITLAVFKGELLIGQG